MNPINQTTLHPYSRSVSIIGVGCTPFMYTMDNPEFMVFDLSEDGSEDASAMGAPLKRRQ